MPPARGLAYTVSVVDKTGKAIHTSKTIFDAMKEARDAFRMKKAQRKEERERRASAEAEKIHREMRRQQRREERTRGHSDEERDHRHRHRSHRDREEGSPPRDRGVRRLHSERHSMKRRNTTDDVALMRHSNMSNLSLATGVSISEPPSPTEMEHAVNAPLATTTALAKDDHLTALFMQCNDIFDNLSAFQCSITTLIGALQRDPETLAVVGLTLAEIANLVTKLSPGVLMTLKASWPMVFAFMASPQFAILAGVAGTTIVLVGGYKIVKKLMGAQSPPEEVEMGGQVIGEVEQRELPDIPSLSIRDEVSSVSSSSSSSSHPSRSASHRDKERRPKTKRRQTTEELLAFSSSSKSTRSDDLAFGSDVPDLPTRSTTEPVRRRSTDHTTRSAPKALPSTERTAPDLAFSIPRKSKSKSSRDDRSERSDRSDRGEKVHVGRKSSGKEKEKVHRRAIFA